MGNKEKLQLPATTTNLLYCNVGFSAFSKLK